MQVDTDLKKQQKGAALIEFAIIMPLLLLLVVGICEFGYAFYHLNILNKSVEDAARYFSDPMQARQMVLTDLINVTTNPAISPTRNLVIYGSIFNTATALMPPVNGSNYAIPTINCVDATSQNTTCSITTEHIKVSATYQHNFILGNTLNRFTNGAIPNVYNLTASSIMRVEGGVE